MYLYYILKMPTYNIILILIDLWERENSLCINTDKYCKERGKDF